ncbi:hypothetical protein J7I98_23470 [Streptomyces sp. ISL-98]|uniref:hypothetical protein n=1 Tax=Streptomyces sp. ISL-98 TaxID=2819192 RepID=UPI001BE982AC|nr:hypothetical protein [Streptomyces sp. ISL-98]MBT2508791.1 hypothetical protein [Streptomyces sp. ISL-98]
MSDDPYKLWITYRILTDDDCEPAAEPQRDLFEFPADLVEPGYGPAIGHMVKAVRDRVGQDIVIVKTRQPGDED